MPSIEVNRVLGRPLQESYSALTSALDSLRRRFVDEKTAAGISAEEAETDWNAYRTGQAGRRRPSPRLRLLRYLLSDPESHEKFGINPAEIAQTNPEVFREVGLSLPGAPPPTSRLEPEG